MIALAETVQGTSWVPVDTQSAKAIPGDFGHLLSAVQDATPAVAVEEQPPEASQNPPGVSQALDSVLQTLADILQPLTYSPGPAALQPSLPLVHGETEADSASAVDVSALVLEAPQAADSGVGPATLAAALAAPAILPSVATPLPQAPTSTNPTTPRLPRSGDVAAALLSASQGQTPSPDRAGTLPTEASTPFPATLQALGESQTPLPRFALQGESLTPAAVTALGLEQGTHFPRRDSTVHIPGTSVPTDVASTPFDTLPLLPGNRPGQDGIAQVLAVPLALPPLTPVSLPELQVTVLESLPEQEVQAPLMARDADQDLPEEQSEQTLSPLSRLLETRLLAAEVSPRSAGPLVPKQPDSLSSPLSWSQDGQALSQGWTLPGSSRAVLLHLDPPGFGPLLVHVRLHEQRLIASFQTGSSDVEAILRANLPALHASLSQHGFEVQPIALSLATDGLSTALGQGSGSFAQQQSHLYSFIPEEPGPDPEARRNDSVPGRLFAEPRFDNRHLIDVVI